MLRRFARFVAWVLFVGMRARTLLARLRAWYALVALALAAAGALLGRAQLAPPPVPCGHLPLDLCRAVYAAAAAKLELEPLAPGGVRPPFPNPFWSQASWAIDGQNSSGCASDTNNCSQTTCGAGGSHQGPCLTTAEMFERWSTISPQFGQDTTITTMSTDVNMQTPIDFEPVLLPQRAPYNSVNAIGWTVTWQCTPTTSAAAIATVTAKNTSTNTRFAVTLSPAVVSPSNGSNAGQSLYIDSTRGSAAWVGNLGASSRFSQPVLLTTLSPGGGAAPVAGAEDNGWTVGDTISVLTLPRVAFTRIVPIASGMQQQGLVQVIRCLLTEATPTRGGVAADAGTAPVGGGDDPIYVGDNVTIIESMAEKQVIFEQHAPNYLQGHVSINSSYNGGVSGGGLVPVPLSNGAQMLPIAGISAGVISYENTGGTGTASLRNVYLHNAPFVLPRLSGTAMAFSGYNIFGEVEIENQAGASVLLAPGGTIDLSGNFGTTQAGLLWGNGVLNVEGRVYYSKAATAAATFKLGNGSGSGAIELEGGTVACCATVANPSVVNCNITLSPTALGAGACSSATPALGDLAFSPSGASIVGQ